MDLWWAYILVGLACGIFSAAFGVGSGIILVPTLVLVFALPQKSAQGVCLAVMVPMALVGAIRYKLNPDIDVNYITVVLLSIGAMVGAFIGAAIAGKVPAHILRKAFAIVMIIAAVKMLLSNPSKKSAAPDPAENKTTTTETRT